MSMISLERNADAIRVAGPLLVACVACLCSCAVIGPRSISGGRDAYAEVINATEDEQILRVMVRMRYDETFGMLSVASITAGLRFRAQAGTNIGIGNSDNYAGNLVPLSIGVAYEENPTISYVPLSGEDFTRRMLSPISVGEWLLLKTSVRRPDLIFDLAISRINGLRNPLLGDAPPSPEFERITELYGKLVDAGVLDYVKGADARGENRYFWDLHRYANGYGDSVREFLDLLGIEAEPDGSPILLPLLEAVGPSSSAIHVGHRSAYEILQLFAKGIDVPADHLEAGIVEPTGSAMAARVPFMHIRSTEGDWWNSRPDKSTVAVRHRDRWFYIDETDTQSKKAFVFLQILIGMRLATDESKRQAPVLTVPVN
jgi:hypothetical protein